MCLLKYFCTCIQSIQCILIKYTQSFLSKYSLASLTTSLSQLYVLVFQQPPTVNNSSCGGGDFTGPSYIHVGVLIVLILCQTCACGHSHGKIHLCSGPSCPETLFCSSPLKSLAIPSFMPSPIFLNDP